MVEIRLLPNAMPELFAQVTSTGKITLADRYGLMAALLEDEVSAEDCQTIDRLFHAVRRGRLKIVDDISNIVV
ncbi:MAG: hypothetical protein RML75_08010 [Cyanobacteriota bacterium SKYGB_h_bin112]|nr:hypothetical protein [Cyanobacteriota bacterium SKYGB_h_bin112]